MIDVAVMVACDSTSTSVLVTFGMKNDSHYQSDSIMHSAISTLSIAPLQFGKK